MWDLFLALSQYRWQAHSDSRLRRGKFRSWCHEQQIPLDWRPVRRDLYEKTTKGSTQGNNYDVFRIGSIRGIWGQSHLVEKLAPLSPLCVSWCACDAANNIWSLWFEGTESNTWYLYGIFIEETPMELYHGWVCVITNHLFCQLDNSVCSMCQFVHFFTLTLCFAKQAAIFCLNACQT